MTLSEGLTILLSFLRAEHTCCLTAAILDFAKGAFFEANRGKNHTLHLYLAELLICVKEITEVVFYFVFSFTVKEGWKKGLKKERRLIVNRQLLYQSSLFASFFASWCYRYNWYWTLFNNTTKLFVHYWRTKWASNNHKTLQFYITISVCVCVCVIFVLVQCVSKILNVPELIRLHTIKWFQILLAFYLILTICLHTVK